MQKIKNPARGKVSEIFMHKKTRQLVAGRFIYLKFDKRNASCDKDVRGGDEKLN
jgi:hypothetical protein